MPEDTGLNWHLGNNLGVLMSDGTRDAWHSGRVNAVIELDDGGLVILASQGTD